MTNFTRALLPGALLAVILLALSACTTRPIQPNIVVIFTDDLDFDELGTFDPTEYPTHTGSRLLGYYEDKETTWGEYPARPLTPNIDRLAAEGMTLTQFRVAATTCPPSRYALLTGQHAGRGNARQRPSRDGRPIDVYATRLQPGQWHLARELKRAGYRTGIVGKWHLNDPTPGIGIVDPSLTDVSGRPTGEQSPTDPAVRESLRRAQAEASRFLRVEHGFDHASNLYMANTNQLGLPRPLRELESNLEWLTAGALKFIEESKDGPFFLYFAPNVPHGLYGSRFADADPTATPEGIVDWHLGSQRPRRTISARIEQHGLHHSAGMPLWLDDSVGAILDRLGQLGLAGNTIVLFTSDHQSRGKYLTYEGARVPAIVRWPGRIDPGSSSDLSLSSVDVVPTLLEAAAPDGAPGQDPPVLDGRSFLPMLLGKPLDERPVLIEHGFARAVVAGGWKYIAVRYPADLRADMDRRGSKYFHRRGYATLEKQFHQIWPSFGEPDQLFNLAEDPFEQHDLARDPAFAAKLEEMKETMRRSLAELPYSFGEFTPR